MHHLVLMESLNVTEAPQIQDAPSFKMIASMRLSVSQIQSIEWTVDNCYH